MSDSHYARILEPTPRLPGYLKPAADKLAARAEPVAARVSAFLRCPVRLAQLDISRTLVRDSEAEKTSDEVFDVIGDNGQAHLRIHVSAATAATVTRSLFGGDVMEKPVLAGISQAFCQQIALAALDLVPAPGEDGTPAPEPEVDLRKAEPGRVGTQPVLAIDLRYALVQPPDVEIRLEFPRAYTDRLSRPGGKLGNASLKTLHFPITAVVAQRKLPIKEIMGWEKGTVVQLPGASTETVSAMVSAGTQRILLGKGDLGAQDGTKCLRITEVKGGDKPAAAQKMAS